MSDIEISPWYWPPNTTVQLCTVPWDAEYRSIVSWSAEGEAHWQYRDRWFDERGRQVMLTNASYMRYGEPIRVPVPVNEAMTYNYVRVLNRQPGDSLRWYFYFITDVRYVSPNTTQLTLQLDVWQTFYMDCEWGRAWIERGHVGIADYKGNVDSYAAYGQTLCTLPEGLDTGQTMRIISQQAHSLIDDQPGVMVTSTLDLFADPYEAADAGSTIQTLPKTTSTGGTGFELGMDAVENYFFKDPNEFRTFLSAMSPAPWVVQGIQSVMTVPASVIEAVKAEGRQVQQKGKVWNGRPPIQAWVATSSSTRAKDKSEVKRIANFRDLFKLPPRYKHLKKLLCWPYAAIELTGFSGQSVILQPELVWDNDLVLNEMSTYNPVRPRVTVYPARYNAQSGDELDMHPAPGGAKVDPGEFLNHAITIDDFPRFAVATNSGMMYMAQNARSLTQQQASASWAQSKAQTANQLSYDQSSNAVGTNQQQQAASMTAQQQQTDLSNTYTGVRGGMGVLTNLGNGNIGGALTSAADAAMSISQASQSTAIDINRQAVQNQAANSLSLFMRDSNKQYADWAAKGDYQQSIAAINARVQDAQVAAPGLHGASGGNHLNTLYRVLGVVVRFKQIARAQLAMVGEYMLTYGYFVQLWCTPPADLHVMSRFSYWKMRDTHVFATRVPESARTAIRGILEKGVTVWRNPDEIGRLDPADNTPVMGNYLNLKAPGEAGW